SGLFIAEGYGCSGYANESLSVEISADTLKKLKPGAYYLYALGMNEQSVTAIDQTEVTIVAPPQEISLDIPGCNVTTDNGNKQVSIDTTETNATVTGNTILIMGSNFTLTIETVGAPDEVNGTITGTVAVIRLNTTPIVTSLDEVGMVSASISANLTDLPEGASIKTTVSRVFDKAESAFESAAKDRGLALVDIAYTMNITTNLRKDRGIANATIRMAVSSDWVEDHGGEDAIRIFRWGDDGSRSVLQTTYKGIENGNMMVFEASSPDGLSIFGLAAVSPVSQPPAPPSGGGGGGGGGGFAPETGSSSPLTGSDGKLLRPYTIRSPSGIAELNLPLGTYAVDAYGNPLSEISIDDLDPADLPAVPAGAAYTFAGHAVVCSPSGARFDPAISLVFTFNADQWSEIMQAAEYDASSLVVKWYDEEAGEWETVPTVVDPATRTVTASVEHFTVFGLFVEPGAVTPVVTPTTPTVTPTTPTTTTPVTPPAEGFPWTYVVIAIVIILVIAVGVYYYTRKP
ncbi:MAG TPA: hypothetical protein PKV78_13720, partial [Methanoculleus thermophilus]|nr:hypothetical protein [Methanoculleus thermophilus]